MNILVGYNPCAVNNGGCKDSEICLPVGGGRRVERRCACPYCKCTGYGLETKMCKCRDDCKLAEGIAAFIFASNSFSTVIVL